MERASTLSRLLSWRPAGRETRDTLFMLLVIAWTIAPHLLRLPAWVGALCLVVLAWRGALAVRQGPLPSRWWLVAILAIAAGLTLWTQRTLFGKDAGVTLLVVRTLADSRAIIDGVMLYASVNDGSVFEKRVVS